MWTLHRPVGLRWELALPESDAGGDAVASQDDRRRRLYRRRSRKEPNATLGLIVH